MRLPCSAPLVAALAVVAILHAGAAAKQPKPPKVRVTSVRKISSEGPHNAFTDLCQFRGRYYLAFRNCPDGHGVHPTSSIVILASHDTKAWEEVHRFGVPKRDVRDPHFLVFHDKLFVYTGTWYCGETSPKKYDLNEMLGYAAQTIDGANWQRPIMLEGTYGHYIWRAATYGEKAYLCGRRKHEFAKTASRSERDPLVESALLESGDGLVWRNVGLFQKTYGDETAFLFEPDGSLLAISRTLGNRKAQMGRSKPPYQDWEQTTLNRAIGGPLLVKWGQRYLVGGRRYLKEDGRAKYATSLYWLHDNALLECAQLPSGGDNSYPGFLALDDQHAVISYYSSHERDASGKTHTAIYLADIELINAD